MTLPSISVCFPAYNEEATIREVLQEAHDLLSQSGIEYELLVCNDGSDDRTGEIIREMETHIPRLIVIHHDRNLGIRATFEELYARASNEFVLLNSTDRQWETSIIFELLSLTGESDIVIASRKDKHYGLMRRAVSWWFNAIPLILFGVKTYDAGAVKLVRREIIRRFEVISRSPFSEAERLIRASLAGYCIREHLVEVARRQTGRARGVNCKLVIEALMDAARLRLALWREQVTRPDKSGAARSQV